MTSKPIDYKYAFTEVGGKFHVVIKLLEDQYDLTEFMPFLSERHQNDAVISLDKNNKVSNVISPDQEEQCLISQYIHAIHDRLDWRKDALCIE